MKQRKENKVASEGTAANTVEVTSEGTAANTAEDKDFIKLEK